MPEGQASTDLGPGTGLGYDPGIFAANAFAWPHYLWWIAGLLMAAGFAVFLMVKRRRGPVTASIAAIERPFSGQVAAKAETGDAQTKGALADMALPHSRQEPAFAALSALPVQISAEATALSRSMMNAALTYRFTLRNLGAASLTDVAIRADITTAHAKSPVTDQVAQDDTELPFTSLMPRIEAGASQDLNGELRMPVSAIRLITQGNAKLYVPLVRLRVEAAGFAPLVHTFVVGIRPASKGGKLLPFRLDEMAQTYRDIGFRALNFGI
ncbi:hypothetical protein [Pontixanthobacter sp.]|uniref:hypothetical protein n=1 Tax=Pontixanthobacter sp. TaxID=2792078 RepID=UPI003C7AE6D6